MNQERIFKVLLAPHTSEKTEGTESVKSKSQIVFKVANDASKLEIKKAVESLLSVKVQRVTTLNVKGKTKRTIHGPVKHNDWKKAYVALQPGQTLDFAASAE